MPWGLHRRSQEVFGSNHMRTLVITAKVQGSAAAARAAGRRGGGQGAAGGHGCPHGRGAW